MVIVIPDCLFDDAGYYRLINAVAKTDKRLALVNISGIDQAVNCMVLHHRFTSSLDAIQNHHLTAVVNRDLNKAASLKNAIGKNVALLGCVSDKEFHFTS
jgi:hypothetical protein